MQNVNKTGVLLLFGGRSTEHEVSVRSAHNVYDALDREKYDIFLVGIDKKGIWSLIEDPDFFRKDSVVSCDRGKEACLVPAPGNRSLRMVKTGESHGPVDVAFPLLHGSFGEDGTIQGLLRLCDIPFVGADVLGSAVGMDKDIMKRLLRDAGIPVPRFRVFRRTDRIDPSLLDDDPGFPLFVKPANLGSSVGISRVRERNGLRAAVEKAFRYDTKIVVEEEVLGREIECAVLGNEAPFASVPGEIVPADGFYSYEAKYIDEEGARLIVPADLEPSQKEEIRRLSVESFSVLGCEGMARVDFFLKKDGKVLVNEINTIPGFTSISMYPMLMAESGIAQPVLLDRLITLGIERHERDKKLVRVFSRSGE